jgi:inositol polyphosphate-4-phosphatase
VLSLLEAIEEHTASTQEDQKRKLMHVLKQKERSLICSHLQETLNIGTGEAGPREAIEATKRLDIVTSQILAAAVTQVMASLNCAAIGSENHRRIWPWILRAGFLFSLQSLVSTRGDERGMLEDLTVAVEWLSTCSIRFVRKAQQGGGRGGGAAVDLSGVETHSPSRPCVWARRLSVSGLIVVDLEVDDAVGDVLKWAMATSGSGAFAKDSQDVGASDGNWVVLAQVSLIGVVFQQGINEQQAVSNAIGNAAHLLQASINEANFGRLGAYYKAYKIAALQINATSIDLGVEMAKWEEAFEALRASVYSPLKTNVHLIIHASCLCRQLSSVHGMCCKSGKDRTSMLVTLEEARLLGDHLRVIGGRKVCNTMRKFGVRRTNVQLNTGQTKYAFNNVQRVFLPPCFQPPTGTYSGSATT